MKFRTEYNAPKDADLLNPQEPIVLIGSCFTDNIGERMRFCRWCAYPNITGTLFNPSSIAAILRMVCKWDDIFDSIKDSIAEKNSAGGSKLYVSWLTDSKCTRYSLRDTVDNVFNRLLSLRNRLRSAKTLIVTFGTAWIYELKDNPGYAVANCHKFPADTFSRRRLSVSEISEEWKELLKLLGKNFPKLRIIFTVSPVRHLKDGFEGNSRSKAILQLACEELCRDKEKVDYFPAYEIMNDDLRDYRFYDDDLVHPSSEAVDYIWEKFQDRYLSPESKALLREGEKVTRRLNHRPTQYGDSELAQYEASLERLHAAEYYNAFLQAHPGML